MLQLYSIKIFVILLVFAKRNIKNYTKLWNVIIKMFLHLKGQVSLLCIELNNYVKCFYIQLNLSSITYASIDFNTIKPYMYHTNYMYVHVVIVIVNGYLGDIFISL